MYITVKVGIEHKLVSKSFLCFHSLWRTIKRLKYYTWPGVRNSWLSCAKQFLWNKNMKTDLYSVPFRDRRTALSGTLCFKFLIIFFLKKRESGMYSQFVSTLKLLKYCVSVFCSWRCFKSCLEGSWPLSIFPCYKKNTTYYKVDLVLSSFEKVGWHLAS